MKPESLAVGPSEVRRPSAIGGGWRRFWHLVWLSAVSEFKQRYATSALGYLWTLLRPLMLFAVLYVVVATILRRFADEVAFYPMILLLGIVLLQFFIEATGGSIRSMNSRGELVRKVQVPRVVMPLSTVLMVAFSLATNLGVVFVWMVAYGVEPMWTWLLLPAVVVPLVTFTSGAALALSALSVRFGDVAQAWPVFSRVLFYSSPVLFPIELVPEGLRIAESFNPLAPILVQARVWIIDPEAPGWFEATNGLLAAVIPFALFGAVCLLGWILFVRQARRAAEEL